MKKTLTILFAVFFIFNGISAQIDLRNIEFSGRVHTQGKGISDVPVTDGYNIVTTDANGYYKLLSNATVDFVYITIPSGYTIPMQDKAPCFYVRITDKSQANQTVDFELQKAKIDDNKHVAIVWADPQVAKPVEMEKCQTAFQDVKNFVADKYKNVAVHGIVCGDIVGDHPEFYNPMKDGLISTKVPFFFVPGNHDMDLYGRSDETSRQTFKKNFGPDHYSVNRGKIHYVMLSNVFYIARGYLYTSYLSERQLNWLQQDLALIPQGSTVVVSLHIPSKLKDYEKSKGAMTVTFQNAEVLYRMLKPYNAHILSGHMHNNDNFPIADNLYEHNHAAICGIFWQAPYCADGTPSGYGVYEADGDKFSWYYKSIGSPTDHQFRVYPVGTNPQKPDEITALVWNYDPTWKVYWYENGVKKGEMKQYVGHDPYTTDYIVKNKKNFIYDWISTKESDHMFAAKPSDPKAKIKVEVTDRFGKVYTQEIK